jgi:hypothetical protein
VAKKSLLVLYSGDDWKHQQPVLSAHPEKTFEVWRRVSPGVEILRASIKWFRGRSFKQAWKRGPRQWEKVRGDIRPTVVFDKTVTYDHLSGATLPEVYHKKKEIAELFQMVNVPELGELIDNKLYQAAIFHEFMPHSILRLPGEVIKNPSQKKIVLKAPEGSGGVFVRISSAKRIPVKNLAVQQDFVRAEKGGHVKDIRIGFFGDEPLYAYHRIAKRGSLFTNVFKGATMEFISLQSIRPLLRLCAEINRPLRVFPKRIYTLDFLVSSSNNRPYLIEVNSMPGTKNFSDTLLEKYFSKLTRYVLS